MEGAGRAEEEKGGMEWGRGEREGREGGREGEGE